MKLRDAIQGYMLRCQSRGFTHRTLQWYEQKLTYFCSYMEDQQHVMDLEAITLLHLRAFTVFVQGSTVSKADAGQGIKPRKNEKIADLTVKGYVQVVKGFFSWCVKEELIEKNPAARLERPKVSKYIIPTFSEEQIQALLAACDLKTALGYRDYTIMLLLLDTGIRVSELCGLRLEDIGRDYIRVFGKGRKEREVGMHPDTAKHIWKYVHKFRHPANEGERRVFINRYGVPLTPSGVAQLLVGVGHRAGITGVRMSAHTFRHTFARMYLSNGGDVYKLSRLMGHSEVQITETYLKDFQSREARKDHEQFSPVTNLKRGSPRGKGARVNRDGSLFD